LVSSRVLVLVNKVTGFCKEAVEIFTFSGKKYKTYWAGNSQQSEFALFGISIVALAAALIAFKAVLIEGSEVAILALATIKQIGSKNVILGVTLGGLGSVVTFVVVRQILLLFEGEDYVIDFATGAIILYFSYRFLRGFVKYYFRGGSFRNKMAKMSQDVVSKDLAHQSVNTGVVVFSLANSVPILSITLTEGFEASLVMAAGGVYDLPASIVGALASLAILLVVSAISYDYLMRIPRWFLDLLAGVVLLSFGLYFVGSGVFAIIPLVS
jgi:uncharacterized membrane protein